ncbi:MAG: DUF5105 domain-containing protein [Clostridiales Family XIII bacterium]|jgi:hypothetical protein|nr:DUF5105 domain-containing protein [Clostridiales Family XIII bacterium]
MKKMHNGKLALTIFVITVLVSAFALSACGSATPSDMTKAELDDFKTEDTAELAKLADSGQDITFPDEFFKKLQEFSYKIGSEAIDGDKATVEVTIDTYDMGTVYKTSSEQVIRDYFEAAKNGEEGSADELGQKMFSAFFEGAKSAENNYSKTVSVVLDKVDGEWILSDSENQELFDAVFGGFLTAVNEQNENMADEAYINELAGL